MLGSSVIYPFYLDAWRHILVGWLGWPETRLAAWVGSWESRITQDINGWAGWFYHEDELHYILPLLVPDDLADRLKARRTRRMYNDLAELLSAELRPAITGNRRQTSYGSDAFNWADARQRVEAVLLGYGSRLPGPTEVGSYERRMIDQPESDAKPGF